MRAFKAPTDLLSRALIVRPCLLIRRRSSSSSSSVFKTCCGCFSGPSSHTFMDVFKEICKCSSRSLVSVAIRNEQKSYTHAQLLHSALKISDLLCGNGKETMLEESIKESSSPSVYGIRKAGCLNGARVGIVAKPSAEFVAGLLGTWFSGGVAVPLALSYPEAELYHVMNDSDVSVLLSTEDHRELMENVAAKCAARFSLIPAIPNISVKMSEHENSTTRNGNSVAHLGEETEDYKMAEDDDPALIIYTSGTTGKPKGVVHTHKSITAQCAGVWQRWRESYPVDGAKVDDAITVFTGVPTIYSRLLQGYEAMDPELQATSASAARQLRLMMCGSSALPYPILKQWESVTGHRLLERYGMTEFVMALSNPLLGERKGGTVGKPLPGVEVKILAIDESEKATGEGELCVRSPSLFKEYWKRPEVTKESFIDGGFFKTGDTVKVDEDGTSADIMKVGGYKLSALEIEAHPDVLECCVLGLPDKIYGEAVTAIIVPDADVKRRRDQEFKPAMSLEELQEWSKDKLAPYKVNKKELKKLLEK
ncbi:Malonate--CoA ligase [Acorus calamus]|uniref:4-coumarate--CoA ligase n=1 Tax=Acorus calamus TaxID=4465 RepID=A0AAV9EJ79_ACOCL|nr:Malonate--CoA ligase [Acorus calamus]